MYEIEWVNAHTHTHTQMDSLSFWLLSITYFFIYVVSNEWNCINIWNLLNCVCVCVWWDFGLLDNNFTYPFLLWSNRGWSDQFDNWRLIVIELVMLIGQMKTQHKIINNILHGRDLMHQCSILSIWMSKIIVSLDLHAHSPIWLMIMMMLGMMSHVLTSFECYYY